MNKAVVNEEIGIAYKALSDVGIAKNGKIEKTYRGQVSTFGAAVIMGSLISAVAFFSQKGESTVERQKLLEAILIVLKETKKVDEKYNSLYQLVDEKRDDIKEEILNAAISLKLAMNLYELTK